MKQSDKKIPYGQHKFDKIDIQSVMDVLKNGPITQGQTVEDFGQALADYSGAKYGIAVSNGTAALHLSVASLGIGPGDEVITTPMTFCATSNAVLYQGGEVKFVDIDGWGKMIDAALKFCHEKKCIKKGDKVIITAGIPIGVPGGTNSIRLIEV